MTDGWVLVFDQSRTRVPIARHKEMYDKGFRVMAGYAGGGSSDKWTPIQEIQSWLSQGPDTGFAALFEIAGTEPIDTPKSGMAHAQVARAAWRARGYPDDCSIAPAVDENVTVTEARSQLTQYFTWWKYADTCKPMPYVEMDAGAILYAEGLSVGTFTPAAFDWDESHTLVTPDNAPNHVVWTQEHDGQNLAGGNVDIGHIRTRAPIMWAKKGIMVTQPVDVWAWDGAKNDPKWPGAPDETAFGILLEARNNAIAANQKADKALTAIAAITTVAVPTTSLSDADVQRIATALAEQLRGTL